METYAVPVLFALLGLAVGSASTHIAEATLARRQMAAPRCPYCTAAYHPLQWSATAALVAGQRRCKTCGRAFRLPRLLAELFLAACWAILVAKYGLTPRVVLAMAALVPQAMILVTDLEAKLVPNLIMLPSLGAMVVLGTLFGPATPYLDATRWWQVLAGATVGFVIFRILVWVGVALFGEGALGEGDITLSAYVGAVVGFPLVLEALVLAFGLGGVGALLVLLLRRGQLRTAIPYGPFIILGCAVTLIWGGRDSDLVPGVVRRCRGYARSLPMKRAPHCGALSLPGNAGRQVPPPRLELG